MIIKVVKEVSIEITDADIAHKRKSGGSFVNEGILKDNVNLAYIMANNRAIELIAKQDKTLVKTSTSLDDQTDLHV